MIKKVKNTVSWAYVIGHVNGEDIVGTFHPKNLKKKYSKNNSLELKK